MTRLVDLSHVIEEGMITYPGLSGPVISEHLSREASRILTLGPDVEVLLPLELRTTMAALGRRITRLHRPPQIPT